MISFNWIEVGERRKGCKAHRCALEDAVLITTINSNGALAWYVMWKSRKGGFSQCDSNRGEGDIETTKVIAQEWYLAFAEIRYAEEEKRNARPDTGKSEAKKNHDV